MLEVFGVITGTRSSLLETPLGFGSQLKRFKCQPPPPIEATPEFHPELSASDINMEDHQLINQRGCCRWKAFLSYSLCLL